MIRRILAAAWTRLTDAFDAAMAKRADLGGEDE